MTTELATTTAPELLITPEQRGFTERQVAMLKQLGIEDASDGDLDLFFHRCQTTGLDPFSKQIYMIGRKTKVGGYRGEPERWETKWTIQTGIDGYRKNGLKAARKADDTVSIGAPMWRGRESGWDDVWLDTTTPPAAARFTLTINGQEYVATAMYHEYVQTKTGGGANAMWSKMPANQLAKCAEAACWRKAYPDDFSGLVLEDAAQIIDEDGAPVTARRIGNGARNVRAAMGIEKAQTPPIDLTDQVQEVPEPEKVPASNGSAVPEQAQASAPAAAMGEPTPISQVQERALATLFKKATYTKWSEQLEWLVNNGIFVTDRKVTKLGDLYQVEASKAIEDLQ